MPFAQFSYRERLRPLVGTVEVVADGLFVDESTATVQRSTQMIADADGRSCLLSVRRVTAGQPQPYALGTSRLVAGGQVLPLVSGADGSLRAAATPPIGFAVNGIEVALEVQGASGPLGLSPFRLPVAGPLQLSVLSPATLGPVDLLPPPQITWIPPTTVVSIVVEVATVDREVVLVCSVVNDGIYQLSSAAVDAYRLEAQGAPATLEVRTESVATVTASVDGQPIVPVTLHVATGVVFDAR